DMRKNSTTFGQYIAVELSEANKRQLFVPSGMYHGFMVLSQEAIFTYKVDNIYQPSAEVSLNYADPTVAIKWPAISAEKLNLSPKDLAAPLFKDAVTF
ncbi:MAG: dTDP-4-dehydrorhamnose 3,5-epimerase, partial [Bacteroidota bacterium]|nr:dTDP-4-dehydrorhamnose 3,5-epimerase [Bacteroidota bacterium]